MCCPAKNSAMTSHSELRVIFWNTRGFMKHKYEIDSLLTETDVFITVESWLSDNIKLDLLGFNIIRQDKLKGLVVVSLFCYKEIAKIYCFK